MWSLLQPLVRLNKQLLYKYIFLGSALSVLNYFRWFTNNKTPLAFRCGHTGFGAIAVCVLIGCVQHVLVGSVLLTGRRGPRVRQSKYIDSFLFSNVLLVLLVPLLPLAVLWRHRAPWGQGERVSLFR